MATGFAVPIKTNNQGGIKLVSGDENDSKIIRLALGDDGNENAFQQNMGLGIGMIFEVSDEITRSQILRRLREVFRRFEAQKRFILRDDTIKWDKNDNQELILEFKYVSIESDEEKLFRQNFNGPIINNLGE